MLHLRPGQGLGPVALTRDGSYLAAMNLFDIPVERKELCKLAILVERNELPVKHLSPAIKHVIKQAGRILKRDMN